MIAARSDASGRWCSAHVTCGTVACLICGLTVALLSSGCGSSFGAGASSTPAALHVVNVAGPKVSLFIAGKVVAVVPCGQDATLVPHGSLPAPPWVVVARARDGDSVGRVSVPSLPLGLLILGGRTGMVSESWPVREPPAPIARCPGESRGGIGA